MRIRNPRSAFTLIELLVVVAIIVTLIAILLPSIGRALYTTNLAMCASNLRQVGVGAFSYSSDYFTAYPHDEDPTPYGSVPIYEGVAYRPAFKPWLMASRSHIDGNFDLVPIWKDYFSDNMSGVFTCPNIATEWEDGSNGRFPWYHTNAGLVSYALMFNTMKSGTITKPMRRVGERWQQAVSNTTQLSTRGDYFNVLAMDPASKHSFGLEDQRGNHTSYGDGGTFYARSNGHGTGLVTYGTLNANYLTDGGGVVNFDGIDYQNTEDWGGARDFFLVPADLAKSDPGPR